MLRSRVSQEYARWWQFWLSKLPQGDASHSSSVTPIASSGHSFFIPADRLRALRSPAMTISSVQCAAGTERLYIDEES